MLMRSISEMHFGGIAVSEWRDHCFQQYPHNWMALPYTVS
jgi:hypothetical protein